MNQSQLDLAKSAPKKVDVRRLLKERAPIEQAKPVRRKFKLNEISPKKASATGDDLISMVSGNMNFYKEMLAKKVVIAGSTPGMRAAAMKGKVDGRAHAFPFQPRFDGVMVIHK